MMLTWVLISLIAGSEEARKLPSAPDVKKLAVCANGFIPNCLFLERAENGGRRIKEGPRRTVQTLDSKKFHDQVSGILAKLKPQVPGKPCTGPLTVIIEAVDQARFEVCQQDYTDKEWDEWLALLK